MWSKEIDEVKKNIMEQVESMDAEDLKKVLGFLDELEKQKKREQGVD